MCVFVLVFVSNEKYKMVVYMGSVHLGGVGGRAGVFSKTLFSLFTVSGNRISVAVGCFVPWLLVVHFRCFAAPREETKRDGLCSFFHLQEDARMIVEIRRILR